MRTNTMAKRVKRQHQPRQERALGPTPERMAKAGEAFEVGHHGVVTIRSSPLEWLERQWQLDARARVPEERRRGLSPVLYGVGVRYRHHWHFSGLLPTVGSIDLNRIFAASSGNIGMPSSEAQAHHRQQYRLAQQAVGLILGRVLDNVVCMEMSLADAGRLCGWRDEETARRKAVDMVRNGLEILRVKLWN